VLGGGVPFPVACWLVDAIDYCSMERLLWSLVWWGCYLLLWADSGIDCHVWIAMGDAGPEE